MFSAVKAMSLWGQLCRALGKPECVFFVISGAQSDFTDLLHIKEVDASLFPPLLALLPAACSVFPFFGAHRVAVRAALLGAHIGLDAQSCLTAPVCIQVYLGQFSACPCLTPGVRHFVCPHAFPLLSPFRLSPVLFSLSAVLSGLVPTQVRGVYPALAHVLLSLSECACTHV